MDEDRKTAVGLEKDILSLLDQVASPTLGIADFRTAMWSLGQALARRAYPMNEERPKNEQPKRIHVVSSVEDFDTVAAGVRDELSTAAEVSCSCLWTQYERISTEPVIDVCPIYQAYHDPEPEGNYDLLFVSSNIGSIEPISAMMMHTIVDRSFTRFDVLGIMSPVVHARARGALVEEMGRARFADWTEFAVDQRLGPDGTTLPGVGGNPSMRSGFDNPIQREDFVPHWVQTRMAARRELRRQQQNKLGM
ncbi:hypothetical protein [Rhizobium sp. LCM 4573]|uniref:hypothetical protein n=1 Tax=Rhizobium sp. LCM 4573 TaxID=1848291 RepID=UPI0008D99700|nr:hypothetical protein [Rhizobium sp. LCM 4573]OHV78664.1 hypothetical protein LCM4573_26195 [Rhizobium sp. LCM 4573]